MWSDTALDPRPHAFRLDFDAPDDLVRAELLVSGKDHLRGVWVNGAPSPLDRPFGWDTHLPFWGRPPPSEARVPPGPTSLCPWFEADRSKRNRSKLHSLIPIRLPVFCLKKKH